MAPDDDGEARVSSAPCPCGFPIEHDSHPPHEIRAGMGEIHYCEGAA